MSDYRKLRTIYDALDAHNFKQSLKLCDAALKKAADTSMVKALKAVTLERMGRTEEGLKLARDVASALAPPADDHLLSTLNIVFKATGHSAEGAAAYASAFEQEPKNEELGASLFGAWLREREYAKAQQLMMKMCAAQFFGNSARNSAHFSDGRSAPPLRYKTFAADKYMFSAVTCLLLQLPPDGRPGLGWALHSSSAAAPAAADGAASKQLQLAAAMMQRALTQGKVTKESQLRLHLESSGASARRARRSSCYASTAASSVWLKRSSALKPSCTNSSASSAKPPTSTPRCSPTTPTTGPRTADASAASSAPTSTMPSAAPPPTPSPPHRTRGEEPARRGPRLARISLAAGDVADAGRGDGGSGAGGDGGALVALLAEYFEAFCHKESCYLDVSAHLAALPPAAAADLCERIRAAPAAAAARGGGGSGRRAADARGLRRAICA